MNAIKTTKYINSLSQAGLSYAQAEVYEILIKNGPLKAGKIHNKTDLKRGLVYKVLEELIEMGLVSKKEEAQKVAVFEPLHPVKLKDIAQKAEDKAKTAQLVLDGVLGKIISDFNLISGKPGVQFFEGVLGLEKIYKDILETGKHLYLVRSIYEPTYNRQMLPIVKRFILARIKKGIKVTSLTPKDEFSLQATPADDVKMLMQRTWVDKKNYSAPVEIDIYGDKIAILSFGQELAGIILQSPQMASALRQIFFLAQKGANAKIISSVIPSAHPHNTA